MEQEINLHHLLCSVSGILDKYQLQEPLQIFPHGLEIDNYALSLMPDDIPDGTVPLVCKADGNCLFNAVSILLCGHESLAC